MTLDDIFSETFFILDYKNRIIPDHQDKIKTLKVIISDPIFNFLAICNSKNIFQEVTKLIFIGKCGIIDVLYYKILENFPKLKELSIEHSDIRHIYSPNNIFNNIVRFELLNCDFFRIETINIFPKLKYISIIGPTSINNLNFNYFSDLELIHIENIDKIDNISFKSLYQSTASINIYTTNPNYFKYDITNKKENIKIIESNKSHF